jgi:hypothetical protein
MQEGLVKLAANLPKGAVVPTGTAMAPMVRAAVRAHIDNIAVSEKQHRPIVNVGDGAAFVKQQLGQFFTTN